MYTQAIVRQPGRNFADGLTEAQLGKPDFELALTQHAKYVDTLQHYGLNVTILPADEAYPDGCFVEDTAIVCEEVAIITNPGAPSRKGEQLTIAEVLRSYKPLQYIQSPGTLDGGDVLRIGDHFYIGVSQRTNQAGADQLAAILASFGYKTTQVPVRSVLHLKTGVTYLGQDTVATIEEFNNCAAFAPFHRIVLSEAESYGADCLPLNDYLFIPAGCPFFRAHLENWSLKIVELEMSEFAKMDGGLTCLSLLF